MFLLNNVLDQVLGQVQDLVQVQNLVQDKEQDPVLTGRDGRVPAGRKKTSKKNNKEETTKRLRYTIGMEATSGLQAAAFLATFELHGEPLLLIPPSSC